MKKIPVILDTDIGNDIDDVWALVMLLYSPEVDIRLVTTCTNNTIYRATLVAKLLEIAGRTDIPIGVGIPLESGDENHADWLDGYELKDYPGTVIQDGVGALVETITNSVETVTLLCIGPAPNIAAALQREPRIAERARVVGMYGSIFSGNQGAPNPQPEFNVFRATHACQMLFAAPWPVTITPLDTCGRVALSGANFDAIRRSSDPLIVALIELYEIWKRNIDWPDYEDLDTTQSSSILFDCVAVHLVYSEEHLVMESMKLDITQDGRTVISDQGNELRVAIAWHDREAFERELAERLTQVGHKPQIIGA